MLFLSRRNNNVGELIYASYTDPGSRSGNNQDSVIAFSDGVCSVFCVADGMGGHTSGDLASNEIIRSIRQWNNSIRSEEQIDFQIIFDSFERNIEEVNLLIHEKYNQRGICGSTVVALICCGNRFCVISVGDSRCYRKSGKRMIQITRDDVWNDILPDGKRGRNDGKLLKAVGVDENLICNRITGEIRKGDIFFLCSDGIYKVLGDEYIEKLPKFIKGVSTSIELTNIMGRIRNDVEAKGAPDNNTGIIILISRKDVVSTFDECSNNKGF